MLADVFTRLRLKSLGTVEFSTSLLEETHEPHWWETAGGVSTVFMPIFASLLD